MKEKDMKDKDDKEEKSGMHDRVRMKGYVDVYQHEDGEDYRDGEKIVDGQPNKFVKNVLTHLVAVVSTERLGDMGTVDWDMYLGDDASTVTDSSMNALVSPIGTTPGTTPDVKSGVDNTEVSPGIWEAGYVCTWYSGTVSGTVGEIALYLTLFGDGFSFDLKNSSYDGSKEMSNRLSVADAEFSSFTIDASKSLTVQWTLRYEFE